MAKIRVLDLCCGSGSVLKALARLYPGRFVYVGVDTERDFNPSICKDVRGVEYAELGDGFDIIRASPPCTEYSNAKSRGVRNLELADSIVQRCLEIIEHYKPRWWFMENPATGRLKTRSFMAEHEPRKLTCSYCKYGCDYKKLTNIWTNRENVTLKNCTIEPCRYKREHGVHLTCAQSGPRKGFARSAPRSESYQVPQPLLDELLGGF